MVVFILIDEGRTDTGTLGYQSCRANKTCRVNKKSLVSALCQCCLHHCRFRILQRSSIVSPYRYTYVKAGKSCTVRQSPMASINARQPTLAPRYLGHLAFYSGGADSPLEGSVPLCHEEGKISSHETSGKATRRGGSLKAMVVRIVCESCRREWRVIQDGH